MVHTQGQDIVNPRVASKCHIPKILTLFSVLPRSEQKFDKLCCAQVETPPLESSDSNSDSEDSQHEKISA